MASLFAIVKAYRFLSEEKREFILSKQLLRSETSIGPNIAEENGAISKTDFHLKFPSHIRNAWQLSTGFPC